MQSYGDPELYAIGRVSKKYMTQLRKLRNL